jgi:hypothetical protein
MSQKTELFITTAARAQNPTNKAELIARHMYIPVSPDCVWICDMSFSYCSNFRVPAQLLVVIYEIFRIEGEMFTGFEVFKGEGVMIVVF